MARTIRGRRTAFDNIAAGSATGPERTIAGDSVSNDGGPDNMTDGSGTSNGFADPTDENTGSSNVVGFVTNP